MNINPSTHYLHMVLRDQTTRKKVYVFRELKWKGRHDFEEFCEAHKTEIRTTKPFTMKER